MFQCELRLEETLHALGALYVVERDMGRGELKGRQDAVEGIESARALWREVARWALEDLLDTMDARPAGVPDRGRQVTPGQLPERHAENERFRARRRAAHEDGGEAARTLHSARFREFVEMKEFMAAIISYLLLHFSPNVYLK